MKRKLFCEISPFTYMLSTKKCQLIRHIKNLFNRTLFASKKMSIPLPHLVYRHNSLIRRRLGNADMSLQENKAINLSLAAPKVTNVLILPGETFSFWHLVGDLKESYGYMPGLTIAKGAPASGIGGGMCQFTNLIHWMVLHSSLEITEHHHHDGLDLFPDFNRQIPFGTGTSILYNYLDYRFCNNTNNTYQLIVYTTDEYLKGELRCSAAQNVKYHIKNEDEHFVQEEGVVYRVGKVYREEIDVTTGNLISRSLLKNNHAKVMYETSDLIITNGPTIKV